MKTLTAFLKADWKGICGTSRNLLVMGIVIFILLSLVQSGTSRYKNQLLDKAEFQEIERLKAESYKNVKAIQNNVFFDSLLLKV